MKHISIFTLSVAIMLVACSTSTANGDSSSADAPNGDFAFLKKLGIDANSSAKLDKGVNFDYDEFLPFTMIDTQQKVLLEEVTAQWRPSDAIG